MPLCLAAGRYRPQRLLHRCYYKYHDQRQRWRPARLTEAHLRRYASHPEHHPTNELTWEASQVSMLPRQVLFLLHYLAKRCRGRVVEIGSYMGGGTVVLAHACRESSLPPVVTVELGGKHDNPFLPSSDILRDLETNLRRFGVADHVEIVRGATWETAVMEEVRARVGPTPIGMLVLDADGNIERDLEALSDLMTEDCILVIDDWDSAYAPEKAALVQECIGRWEKAGRVESFGVHGLCTWIGRTCGRPHADSRSNLPAANPLAGSTIELLDKVFASTTLLKVT